MKLDETRGRNDNLRIRVLLLGTCRGTGEYAGDRVFQFLDVRYFVMDFENASHWLLPPVPLAQNFKSAHHSIFFENFAGMSQNDT